MKPSIYVTLFLSLLIFSSEARSAKVGTQIAFLADVHLVCETCKGQRFKEEVLDIKYKKHNIFDVLGLSIEEAILFFEGEKDIVKKLQPLEDVGLGYVKLGQSSSTLSGGESQRLKLASFLIKQTGRPVSKETAVAIGMPPISNPPKTSVPFGSSGTNCLAMFFSKTGSDSNWYLSKYSPEICPERSLNSPVI